MKGCDVVANFLADNDIKVAFGIIGSGNASIWDAIHRRGFTEIICVHHEQAAVMAVGSYFRTTGKMSAALVTTGAGSTNAVTGVVSNWMDSLPGLIISGNENSKFTRADNPLRVWGIQGYDSSAMVQHVTKYSVRVCEPNDVRFELEKGLDITRSGRPGPVWIDIPMNIQSAPINHDQLKVYTKAKSVSFISSSHGKSLADSADAVIRKLEKSERPLLWIGQGFRLSGKPEWAERIVEALKVPALVTWNGMDLVPDECPYLFGRAGVYGQRYSNFILQNCDFLLAIGTRLAMPQVGYDISELARGAEVAVIDIDSEELKKYAQRCAITVAADAVSFAETLETQLGGRNFLRKMWLDRCVDYREKFPVIGPEHADKDGFLNSYRFMDRLCDHLSEKHIIVTDMGTALLSGHQVIRLKRGQRMMTSTGLGEMGYGLPGAIGAAVGSPASEILCLNCDGGMMMNLQELQTIAHHQFPIKIVVFNNDGYLMIKHTQRALFEGRRVGVDRRSGVTCPDFNKVAKAFDFPAFAIRTWKDFDEQLPNFLASKGPALCEVFMSPDQLFVPKLSLAPQKDGSIVSPPLEDLFPFVKRKDLRDAMIVGVHPKSAKMEDHE